MYICIYVYMYICIYVYMYICIDVYMYICIDVYMYIRIHVYMYTPLSVDKWVVICVPGNFIYFWLFRDLSNRTYSSKKSPCQLIQVTDHFVQCHLVRIRLQLATVQLQPIGARADWHCGFGAASWGWNTATTAAWNSDKLEVLEVSTKLQSFSGPVCWLQNAIMWTSKHMWIPKLIL